MAVMMDRVNVGINKHSRLQDRLHPDTTIKICYDDQGDEPRFITGYWSSRGLGAPIRMLLSAAQVNHWVVMYDVKEEGDDAWNKDSWLADKEWIQKGYNRLANLPFLIDCRTNMVLVQTNAIMCYLGRELVMLGRSPPMTCRCEELLCEIMDLRNLMVRFAYHGSPETAKRDAENLIQGPAGRIFDKLENHLQSVYPGVIEKTDAIENGYPGPETDDERPERQTSHVSFLVGNGFTAPDFCLYEMLDQYLALCRFFEFPSITRNRFYLADYFINFASIAENRPFLGCEAAHVALPFNNPYARFGSDWESNGTYSRGQDVIYRNQGVIKESRTRTRPAKRQKSSWSSSTSNGF